MLTFIQYITELFDQTLPFTKKINSLNGNHEAKFHTDNAKYHVHFTHYNEKSKKNSEAHVDFASTNSPLQNKMKINNKEGHGSLKVFSTVHHIIKKHMEEHPHIQHISFTAAHDEPTRVKLYSHLMKRFANKHTEKKLDARQTIFKAHRDDFK